MRAFLRDRADELEQMLNWVSDQDRQWWPFVFLRPEPWKRMSSLRVGALSLLLGVFFGILANIAVAFTTNREDVLEVGPLKVQADVKNRHRIPPLVSLGTIAVGLVVFATGVKKK
jgi:hypothetical protein